MRDTKISNEIKQLRISMGLSQTEFCRLFNSTPPRNIKLTQDVLSKYESGVYLPRVDKYRKIRSLSCQKKAL